MLFGVEGVPGAWNCLDGCNVSLRTAPRRVQAVKHSLSCEKMVMSRCSSSSPVLSWEPSRTRRVLILPPSSSVLQVSSSSSMPKRLPTFFSAKARRMRHCQQVSGDALATRKTALGEKADSGLIFVMAISHSLHLVAGRGLRDISVLTEEGDSSHHVDNGQGAA